MRGALAVSHSPIIQSCECPACGMVPHSAASMHGYTKDVYFTLVPKVCKQPLNAGKCTWIEQF